LSHGQIAFALSPSKIVNPQKTRKDVYLLSLNSKAAVNLTPHDHGAVSSLQFSPNGDQLVWLEMAEDGYESDRNAVVTYDLAGQATTIWNDKLSHEVASVAVSCSVRLG
jgi:hypothetical protein